MPPISIECLLLLLITIAKCTSGFDESCRYICLDQTRCEDCVRSHPCCGWCFDENYIGNRCDYIARLNTTCDPKFITENSETKAEPTKNEVFTDVEKEADIIQMRPQEFNIKLRKGEPYNITIEYKAAKNHPLDLYYLMDLTLSMKEDLQTLTQLGQGLTKVLTELTENHRIAFGSYVDKKAMPFYMTDPEDYHNPCRLLEGMVCDEGYLFKHRLNFTEDIDDFISKVKASKVSANLDNLEGGFDALMQLLLCQEEVGWSEKSRKLILLATESMQHLAGDGLLSGSTKRNVKQCLIDPEGNYVSSLVYDYPSLGEIYHQLKNRKINLIVASKNSSILYYQEIHKLLPESTFVSELEEDSTNILQLVKDGYYDFMKRVTLSMNTTAVKGLQVDFFADCFGNGYFNKTNTCFNVEEGKPINFVIQLLLSEYQDVSRDTLYVEERSIDERVKLDVEFIGSKCECPMIVTRRDCGPHGSYVCGNCTCDEGWTGNTCSELCDAKLDKCRYQDETGEIHVSCFGHGLCICGKCECNFPYSGKFCNYTCPFDRKTKMVCGGPNRGYCEEGGCKCTEHYTGEDCTCPLSRENCKIPGTSTICNGHGSCKCNRCNCDPGYQGRFCETCSECEGLCNIYMSCVVAKIHNKTDTCIIGNATIKSTMVTSLREEIPQYCYYRYNQNCETRYSYSIRRKNEIDVEILEPSCYAPMQAVFSIGGIILASIISVGFLTLLIWKFCAVRRDRIEYQRFIKEREQTLHREENPLYKSPIVHYNNPMEMATFSKNFD